MLLLACCFFSLAANAQQALKIRQQAPEIALSQPDGQPFHLSALKGALVLVDFWATWCAPCVQEQPALKAIYQKNEAFVKQGKFQILGVSLDSKKEHWEKGISKLAITWPQVSDLRFWKSPVAKAYGVEALPFNVLVDESGKIIAFNLHGKELEDFIHEHLSGKP